MDTYIKGESIELEISLVTNSGVIINLASLATIAIKVFYSKTNKTFKEGSYAGGEVTYSDAATGVISFYLEDGLTLSASTGAYRYLVTVTEVDSGFDDNTDTGKYEGDAFRLS